MSEAYRDAGVDIQLGDNLSNTLYEAAKQTWSNRQGIFGDLVELHDSFSGFRAMPASLLGNTENVFLGMSDDGVGTKVEVAERIADHSTVAFDLFAMVCDDAVVRGAEPVAVTTTLDIRKLDESEETRKAIAELARGYIAAAHAAGVVVVNGEVAELGTRVGGFGEFNYNWSATVLWAALRDRILDGSKIQPGDHLVGLKETGFRSNGLSLVRKIMLTEFGEEWHKQEFWPGEEQTFGEAVRRPSTIYSRAVVDMTGGFSHEPQAEVHGIAHITGGGLPGKIGRMLLPSGLGANIDNPFQPGSVMVSVQALAGISDEDAYTTWNMGQGMVIASPEPGVIIDIAKNHKIDARIIGSVREDASITIRSRGTLSHGSELNFDI